MDGERHTHNSTVIAAIIISALVFGGIGYWIANEYQYRTTTNTTTYIPNTTASTKQPPQTKDETANWKTYSDTKTGFTFKYPPTAVINSSEKTPASSTAMYVSAYNLKTMEDEPLGYDKASLTRLRDDLISGQEKAFVAGLYAREYLTFMQGDICTVQFTRTLDVFDGKDIAVSLAYSIPASQFSTIFANNPQYFTTDKDNCGEEKIWKEEEGILDSFVNDLKAMKTDTLTQDWYHDFAKIAETFKFTK